jgi:hypothetical protein
VYTKAARKTEYEGRSDLRKKMQKKRATFPCGITDQLLHIKHVHIDT